jgi:hypothetical protein
MCSGNSRRASTSGDVFQVRLPCLPKTTKPRLPEAECYTCIAPVHGNPMLEMKELDWKILRRVHPPALERFSKRVLAEIDRISGEDANSYHARSLQIFGMIQQDDREIARVCSTIRDALMHSRRWPRFARRGCLERREFSSPSPETRDAIQMLLVAG